MERKPTVTSSKSSNETRGSMWVVGLVGSVAVLAAVSKCSPPDANRTAAEIAANDPTVIGLKSSVAAQPAPALEALNSGSVTTGFSDMSASVAAEGLSGAMIYSQNCYDALSRTFSWRSLDVCGAADLKAVAVVPEEDVGGLEKEIAYFQSEVAAARYLGAATGGGTSPENADARFAKMQARLPTSEGAAKGSSDPANDLEPDTGTSTDGSADFGNAVDNGSETT